jgi:outer membrane lipoprotein-sorting protein
VQSSLISSSLSPRHLRTAGMLLALSLSGLTPSQGQKAPVSSEAQKAPASDRSAAQSGNDPAAIALRDKLVRAYHDLRSFHEKVIQKQWKTAPEQAITIEIEMRYRSPNRLYLNVDYPQVGAEGRWHLTLACDGKTLTLYNSAKNEFQRVKAPSRLDRLVLPTSLRGPEFDLILRDINPFSDLEKQAAVRYSEAFELSGSHGLHLLKLDLQQGGARRALLYRLDPNDHLLRGLKLSILPDTTDPDPFLEPEKAATVEAEYTLVERNPRLSNADFAFTPPAGARESTKPASKPATPR